MTDLADLYQAVILDHNRAPRNFRRIEPPRSRALAHNPVCGDTVEIFLRVADGRVKDLAFLGDSCAVATASASLLTELLKGRSTDTVRTICRQFEAVLSGDAEAGILPESLQPMARVLHFPGRVQCARLAVQAVDQALHASRL